MRKVLIIAAVIMAGVFTFVFANQPKIAKTEVPQAGEVIQMNNDMFVKNVFNYTDAKEWKYIGKKPIVIDFYADWCGPCRRVAPIMKELAKEYEAQVTIYKVDTDKEKALAGAMGIQSLPTIVFIPVNGKPQTIMGAADKATFKKAIDEILLGKKEKK